MKNKIFTMMVLTLLCQLPLMAVQGKFKDKEIEHADVKEMTELLTPLKGTTPAQWRVYWTGGDASKTVNISWTTAEKGKSHNLHYGTTGKGKKFKRYQKHVSCKDNGEYTLSSDDKSAKVKPAYYHHVSLKGLKPKTKYYFVLESDGEVSKQLYFITAPASGTDFSMLYGGDSRSGHSSRCRMNLRMAYIVEKNSKIYGLIHGGDYIASGKHWGQWRLWLSHNELLTCSDGRVLPIIPARGNHDSGPLYKEVFNIDPKDPDWHTTLLGKDVSVITLDTNVSSGGKQEDWLKKQLKKYRKKNKWLVAQYHRPFFPAVKDPGRHAKTFVPLFEKYNLDLACESDGHCIKRTVPIRDGKEDPTGVTYIGEGGLGVGQYKPKTDRWYLKKGLVSRGHHVMELSFSKTKLGIRTILMNGKEFDDFDLKIRK